MSAEARKKLDGLDEEVVCNYLLDSVKVSGDEAIDTLDTLLRRISPARFEKTTALVNAIRHFGGRVRFMHRDDLEDEDLNYVWCYTDECGEGTLGTYCHLDSWVTVPLDRHRGWGTVEATLRHELIHLLQDVTDTRPRTEDRDLPLLSTKLRWSDWLAELCLKEHDRQEAQAESAEEVTPLCEIEAHSVDTWGKTVLDWVEEVKRRELYAGHWYCPLGE